jgi:hypothetical protein
MNQPSKKDAEVSSKTLDPEQKVLIEKILANRATILKSRTWIEWEFNRLQRTNFGSLLAQTKFSCTDKELVRPN